MTTGPRRLIDTHSLRFAEFDKNDVSPQYAILSHRWIEGEEVTFQEFLNPEGREEMKKKSGYRKILRACMKARNDGINFIWIDTCCIDKGNHDEVARDIKSMYAYYENSVVCYAYLVDVYKWYYGKESSRYREQWRKWMFEDSEWFQRGWTLQELLAPKEVVFFSHKWNKIGTREGLKELICSVTAIPLELLGGKSSLKDFDVKTRMSWAMGRMTTKPPDRAYCLLGILDITVEPDYDEDVETVFRRLQDAFEKAHPNYLDAESHEKSLINSLVYQNVNDRMQTTSRRPKPMGDSMEDHLQYLSMCNLYASYRSF
ncbi:HET-domain-containing protein, partial [Dendrothele bispora CBS 962.96]